MNDTLQNKPLDHLSIKDIFSELATIEEPFKPSPQSPEKIAFVTSGRNCEFVRQRNKATIVIIERVHDLAPFFWNPSCCQCQKQEMCPSNIVRFHKNSS